MQRLIAALGLFATVLFTGVARADSINLNFSGSSYGYTISGTLTAVSSGQAGAYQIVGISGSGDGNQILSLANSGTLRGNDNLLYSSSLKSFDSSGVGFLMANGTSGNMEVNLFADPGSASGYSALLMYPSGAEQVLPLDYFTTSPPVQVTPEPSSLWLLGTALLICAAMLARHVRRTRRLEERVAG